MSEKDAKFAKIYDRKITTLLCLDLTDVSLMCLRLSGKKLNPHEYLRLNGVLVGFQGCYSTLKKLRGLFNLTLKKLRGTLKLCCRL